MAVVAPRINRTSRHHSGTVSSLLFLLDIFREWNTSTRSRMHSSQRDRRDAKLETIAIVISTAWTNTPSGDGVRNPCSRWSRRFASTGGAGIPSSSVRSFVSLSFSRKSITTIFTRRPVIARRIEAFWHNSTCNCTCDLLAHECEKLMQIICLLYTYVACLLIFFYCATCLRY